MYFHRFKIINILILLFLIGLFFLGINTYQDYGISWDEPISRYNGMVSFVYLADLFNIQHSYNVTSIFTYRDRFYGVAFELPLFIIEHFLHLKDKQNIYFMRHLVTHLFFLFSLIFMYLMVKKRFNDYLAFLAILILVLSPRIYANSFYNDKDIIFMSAYLIASYAITRFILHPSFVSSFLAAFFSAFAIDVRLPAVIIPLLLVAFFIVRFFKNEASKKDTLFLLNYIIFLILFIILMWPWLWINPIEHFMEAFEKMSHFHWRGSLLYMGDIVKGSNVPWHYIFVWIAITTPIVYLILFVFGIANVLKMIFTNHITLWKNDKELQDYLFLSLLFSPLLSVIVLNSTLYDGWRHLYFIYPFFIMIALIGVEKLFQLNSLIFKTLISILLFLSMSFTTIWMYNHHPKGNVYFNLLAGQNIQEKFEVDYWGLSNKKALEYIVANDSTSNITVGKVCATPLPQSIDLLNTKDKNRIHFIEDYQNADYIINNYRLVPADFDISNMEDFDKYYILKTDNTSVVEIYKNNKMSNTKGDNNAPK